MKLKWLFAGVALVGIGGLMAFFFTRSKPITVAELRFPLVLMRPEGSAPWVIKDAASLQRGTITSEESPAEGTIIIDSNFTICTEQNVKSKHGEIGMLAHALLRPTGSIEFTFDLTRARRSGLAAALEYLTKCPSYPGDIREYDRKRADLARQTTMAGIVALLQEDPPAPDEAAAPRATQMDVP